MISPTFKIIPYARRYRRALLDLANDGRCKLHLHLDWHVLEDWITHPNVPIFLAWQERDLLGVIAGSIPQANTAWLRMVALKDEIQPPTVLMPLWENLRRYYREAAVNEIGVLLTTPWISEHLGILGFAFQEHIVTLNRDRFEPPPAPRIEINIRHSDFREADKALVIDNAAFGPMWQMNAQAIRQAVRDSSSFTFAELDQRPVGYQITSQIGRTAHLSRLAVLPGLQGKGIGGALLSEMIGDFLRRGVMLFSVNTQETNLQSRRLYEHYGFEQGSPNMPYWSVRIS